MKLSDKERERLKFLDEKQALKWKSISNDDDENDFRNSHPHILSGNIECGFSCPKGWYGIVGKLCEDITPLINDKFKVEQVKEKFGGLRFYSNASKEVQQIISKAEDDSLSICQECGAEGKKRSLNWIRILCDECAAPELEHQYLNDKNRAWGEDEEGLIFVNPKQKRSFSNYNFELKKYEEEIRLPSVREVRTRFSHGSPVLQPPKD